MLILPPGTAAAQRKRLAELGSSAGIVSHPEFLRHRADHLALFAQLFDG